MTDFDVVISGAGPAGSSLAILLGKAGLRVLLADRFYFPRDKVCGECISPGAFSILEKLGLREKLDLHGTEKVTGVTFYSPSRHSKSILYPDKKNGYAISRRKLDKLIIDEAAEHNTVTVMQGFLLKKITIEQEQVIVTGTKDKKEASFSAKLLVAADGRYSTIAKLLGNYRLVSEFKRYVYVATLENVKNLSNNIELIIKNRQFQYLVSKQGKGLASIAVVINQKNFNKQQINKETFIQLLRQSRVISEKLGGISFESQLKGIILQRYKPESLVSDRVIYIGDTTGFIDPITGEGMYRAFKSAELAAVAIKDAFLKNSFQKYDLLKYQENLLKEFNPVYKFIKMAVFLTTNEYVSNFIVKRMQEDSDFARKLVSLQGAIIPGKELYSPETVRLCLKLLKK